MANTPNINLIKPIVGGDNNDWGGYLNDDMDRIDAVFTANGTGTSVGMNVGAGKTLNVDGTLKVNGTISATTSVDLNAPVAIAANSSSPALKVTQSGSGHALYVEDQTSDPTPSLVVSATGLVGIGTSSPSSLLDVAVSSGPVAAYVRTSGTTVSDTSNLIAQANSYSVQNVAYGTGETYVVSNPTNSFRIGTSSNSGISFFTNSSEKMALSSGGNFSIGGTTNPAVTFYNQKTLSASESFSNLTSANIGTGVSSAFGYSSTLTTQANASPYTVAGVYHYAAYGSANGANSTVTSQYGFLAGFNLTNAVNNYGFFGDIAAGANRWNVYMSGTAQNYFAGSVGIGTTVPATKLHVLTADGVTTARFSGASFATRFQSLAGLGAYVDGTDATETLYRPLFVGGSTTALHTSGTTRLFVDASGNVGVNTVSPLYAFDVYKASGSLSAYVRNAGTAGTDTSVFGVATGAYGIVNTVNGSGGSFTLSDVGSGGFYNIGTISAAPVYFSTQNTYRMTISSTGLVGIGTTSPAVSLDVSGTIRTNDNYQMSGNSYIYSYAGGSAATVRAGLYNDGTNQTVALFTAATQRVTVDGSGNMGVGTTSPARRFHVVGANGPTSFARLAGATYAARLISSVSVGMVIDATSADEASYQPMLIGGSTVALTTSGTTRVTVTAAGDMGVGTTTPAAKLDVSGAARIGGNATVTGNATVNGDLSVDNNLKFDSGYGSTAVAFGCRAWVNYDGTGSGTVRASGNIASVTRTSAGQYTIAFSNAMPDANYCVNVATGLIGVGWGGFDVLDMTTASFKVRLVNLSGGPASFQDSSIINISVFR